MFTEKKDSLFEVPVKKTEGTNFQNKFLQAGFQKAAETRSGNGALKFSTTGNDFVDQFNNLGVYRKPRTFQDISKDASTLWANNPRVSVMFILFLRIISRVVTFWNGNKTETVQKGAGLKHEAIMRMIWLHINHPAVFWKNIQLFIASGSWKDVFEMLRYDLMYNGWENKVLDWNKFGNLIAAGLENDNTTELVKKYLPQIKAKSKAETLQMQANTIIGKFICSYLKINYVDYRKLKSSGKAHTWQQLISKRLYDKLNFDSVHGRALLLMVSGKFIANQKLEDKYENWIAAKPVAKFTGYVHELAMKITDNLKKYQKDTLNKQYEMLLQMAKNNVNLKAGFIVARDTSASMNGEIPGTKFSSGNVAKAMGIFFGDMLTGAFKDAWIEFHSTATLRQYKGSNFVEKWQNDRASFVGSTNFMAICDIFVRAKLQGVPEADFPTGILCISDGEFNPSQLGKTNVQTFRMALREAGFSQEYCDNFKIILWNIPNNHYGEAKPKFETFGDVANVFYLSGYDGSLLGFLLGTESGDKPTPKTADELFNAAMDQEVLSLVEV